MSLIQIANIVGAVFVMGGNVYTVISPWDVYYTGRETYFTPAPWSYFIWWVTEANRHCPDTDSKPTPRPLIHMLILGTCIYQFSGRGKEIILERIGWRLPLLDFLNAMYIYSWTIQEYRYGAYHPYRLQGPPSDDPSALVFILFAVSVVTVRNLIMSDFETFADPDNSMLSKSIKKLKGPHSATFATRCFCTFPSPCTTAGSSTSSSSLRLKRLESTRSQSPLALGQRPLSSPHCTTFFPIPNRPITDFWNQTSPSAFFSRWSISRMPIRP